MVYMIRWAIHWTVFADMLPDTNVLYIYCNYCVNICFQILCCCSVSLHIMMDITAAFTVLLILPNHMWPGFALISVCFGASNFWCSYMINIYITAADCSVSISQYCQLDTFGICMHSMAPIPYLYWYNTAYSHVWNALQRVWVKYKLNIHMHKAIYHRGYCISVVSSTKCTLIVLLMYATAALQTSGHLHWLGDVTTRSSCEPTDALHQFEFPLLEIVAMAIPPIRLQFNPMPDRETWNVRCLALLKWMCTIKDGSLPINRVQWHAPDKMSRGYMKVRWPITTASYAISVHLHSIRSWKFLSRKEIKQICISTQKQYIIYWSIIGNS